MRFKGFALFLILLFGGIAGAADQTSPQDGNIDVRSTLVGTRVYLGDAYVGDADIFLENIAAGEHMITMRQGSQRITGMFTLKPGETLMLEGRFEENRIVDLKEVAREEAAKRAEAEKKAEVERKAEAEREKEREKEKKKPAAVAAKPEPKKHEAKKPEPKKPVVATKQRNPEEERRDLHVNILKVEYTEDPVGVELKFAAKANTKVVTNFNDSSLISGKLYRSKQNYVLCEGTGCSRDWTGRFFYIDDVGKRDAFLIRFRQSVFSGITPSGTTADVMDICLNGDCSQIKYSPGAGGVMQSAIGRYTISWAKSSFILRRTDLMREIIDAGGKFPDL